MTSLKDLTNKRKIIMDHYLQPVNKGKIVNIKPQHFFSNHCIDQCDLYWQINHQTITNFQFEGKGCAIFIASVDLMIEQIKHKNLHEVDAILKNYEIMIYQNGNYDEKKLGNLVVFNHVKTQLNRLHCAEIILIALKKIMAQLVV